MLAALGARGREGGVKLNAGKKRGIAVSDWKICFSATNGIYMWDYHLFNLRKKEYWIRLDLVQIERPKFACVRVDVRVFK